MRAIRMSTTNPFPHEFSICDRCLHPWNRVVEHLDGRESSSCLFEMRSGYFEVLLWVFALRESLGRSYEKGTELVVMALKAMCTCESH